MPKNSNNIGKICILLATFYGNLNAGEQGDYEEKENKETSYYYDKITFDDFFGLQAIRPKCSNSSVAYQVFPIDENGSYQQNIALHDYNLDQTHIICPEKPVDNLLGISASGIFAAWRSKYKIYVFNTQTQEIKKIRAPRNYQNAVCFSSDDTLFVHQQHNHIMIRDLQKTKWNDANAKIKKHSIIKLENSARIKEFQIIETKKGKILLAHFPSTQKILLWNMLSQLKPTFISYSYKNPPFRCPLVKLLPDDTVAFIEPNGEYMTSFNPTQQHPNFMLEKFPKIPKGFSIQAIAFSNGYTLTGLKGSDGLKRLSIAKGGETLEDIDFINTEKLFVSPDGQFIVAKTCGSISRYSTSSLLQQMRDKS